MALDSHGLKALRLIGGSGACLTFGRLHCTCSNSDLWPLGLCRDDLPLAEGYPVADPVFDALGYKAYALDINPWHGAAIGWDMNYRMSRDHGRFDLVYDGGSIEHVFNLPICLENLMELVALNGHLIIHTLANGLCGHGFYQLSPELFANCLTMENGFVLKFLVLHSARPGATWRKAPWARREVTSFWPVLLLACARRVEIVPIRLCPQQTQFPLAQSAKAGRLAQVCRTLLAFGWRSRLWRLPRF